MTIDPYAPLDILMYLAPNGTSFALNIYAEPPGHNKMPPGTKTSVLSSLISGKYSGSIAEMVEDDLYIAAYQSSLLKLGNCEKTGIDQILIVSDRMKNLIESFPAERSEFIPVHTSLLRKHSRYPRAGGGEIVDGTYWLWHNYNWLDLVDDSSSEWKETEGSRFTYREKMRSDLPDQPVQSIRFWGGPSRTPGRKLILKDIDYDRHPFFRIVGMVSGLFISPAVAAAIKDAGLLFFEGDVCIFPTELQCEQHYPRPTNFPEDGYFSPPLRIYGTDIVVPNDQIAPLAIPGKS